MPSNNARYNLVFVLVHWALASFVFVELGIEWPARAIVEQHDQIRHLLSNIHISLGITIAILLVIQIVLRLFQKAPTYPEGFSKTRRIFGYALYFLIYICLAFLLISGYLRAVFSGTPVKFWGTPLPDWDAIDLDTAQFFASAHGTAAFVFTGLVLFHITLIGLNTFKHPGFAARMLPSRSERALPGSPVTVQLAQSLAKNLRFSGWAAFWSQLALALFSGLLLEFATSGRAFSPSGAGRFGDAIYWAVIGFLLLCIAIVLAFYYTRAARKIASKHEFYLRKTGIAEFWFLLAGLLVGLTGAFVSFIGVALSISLLIVKTVSQPPGIAITDPTKIVRAIDVFILLVNFDLLIAHCIGVGLSVWLIISIPRARLKYLVLSHQQPVAGGSVANARRDEPIGR